MTLAIVIDGNNMAWRARYAYSLSFDGQDTSVTYGVIRMLQALVNKYKPVYIVFCWDGGTPNFRKELVPSYKANRKKDDPNYPEFIRQLQELQGIIPYLGILQVRRRGIEADDLTYHAAKMIDANRVYIVTNDDDLYQAIDDRIAILKPSKSGYNVVIEDDLPVPVDNFVDWKVWQGDSSDNIPGVKGIGPKTATTLVVKGDSCIPDRLRNDVHEFFSDGRYNAAYRCIDLSIDRTGARLVLVDEGYTRFDKSKVTRWCIDRGFASVIQAGTHMFGRLKRPIFDYERLALPRIWSYRRYMGDLNLCLPIVINGSTIMEVEGGWDAKDD